MLPLNGVCESISESSHRSKVHGMSQRVTDNPALLSEAELLAMPDRFSSRPHTRSAIIPEIAACTGTTGNWRWRP